MFECAKPFTMSINQSQSEVALLARASLLKPSHRTRPEQCVGLGIFLLICLAFEALSATPLSPYGLWALSLTASIWTLWRRYSIRVLKLELAVFFAQFLFQVSWNCSFFYFHEMLLALVALLLLWCNTLLAAVLFWKKERISSLLLLFPLVWIFYLAGLNMMICLRS